MEYQVDKIDRDILRLLQKDANLSMDALAGQVGLSRNACWRRVRAMEDADIIRKRVALVDASALGCGLSVFVMVRTNTHTPEWLAKFKHAIASFPQISGAYRMTGDLDYVLKVRVADVADYDRFYQRLIAQVPMSDISASFVMDEIKETTELPL